MILATIKMTIPPQKRGEVLKVLENLAELCTYDPGCLSCNVYRDLHDNKVIVLEQAWKSKEDLDHHLRSEEYRNLLLILELALKQPEIRFDTISGTTGIETIERARSHTR
jgi:quinol monooxygenase YgiN